MWLTMAAAWACTGDVETRVVGWKPDGSLALLRHERTDVGEPALLDITVYDVAAGKEVRRMPILTWEDKGDAAKRSANWKRAEAEATALGIVVQPDIAPVKAGSKGVYTLPSGVTLTTLVETHEGATPDDPVKIYFLEVRRKDGALVERSDLARWPHYSNANFVSHAQGVWAAPGGAHALLALGHACVEPTVHSVKLPEG